MTRSARRDYAAAAHHITSRGVCREPLVHGGFDRQTFFRWLERSVARCGWNLFAYCLMTNHYHLVLIAPEAALIRGMHLLNGGFAQAFNRRHATTGHVFE